MFRGRGELTGRERRLSVDDDDKSFDRGTQEDHGGSEHVLKLEKVDLLLSKNRETHNTSAYQQEDLILRRGQKFDLEMTFNRNVSSDDIIVVEFSFGKRPRVNKGTLIQIRLVGNKDDTSCDLSKTWCAHDVNVSGTVIRCVLNSSADTFIGKYDFAIKTKLSNEKNFTRHTPETEKIIFICNPWCKEDAVYMEDEEGREEFVLKESGNIYQGQTPKKWVFGQFQEPCLNVALLLMDMYGMPDIGRASVVSILRCMSAMANSNDKSGVLVGRWEEPFPADSTPPWDWTGSISILKEFDKNKTNVEYGQCWVFSGLLTTLCRTLGIPTRSVTNIDSAHDTDMSMTIDWHVASDGRDLEFMNDDIWNFHVWNEAWVRRKDLPDGFDGWQAFDSTPQESSEGVKRCGPAPVRAIKEGYIYLNYDVGFIFAEVNGDVILWRVEDNGDMYPLKIFKSRVGKKILTSVNNKEVNLTNTYKYPEGSEEERRVVRSVHKYSTKSKLDIYGLKPEEIDFEVIFPENTLIGDNFTVKIKVKNKSTVDQWVELTATLNCAYYHGVAGKKVSVMRTNEFIPSNNDKIIEMEVNRDKYLKIMNTEGRFQIFVSGKTEDGRMNAQKEIFVLQKPKMTIEGPDDAPVGQDTVVVVKYKNTTSIKQTNVKLHIEGAGLLQAETKPQKDLKPDDEIKTEITVHPTMDSYFERDLNITLSSAQFVGVSANHTFQKTKEYVSHFS